MAECSIDIPILVRKDPALQEYSSKIVSRIHRFQRLQKEIEAEAGSLESFGLGHLYFGLHDLGKKWVIREWAPNARSISLIGHFNHWQEDDLFSLKRCNEHGIWELYLPKSVINHGDEYRLRIHWEGGQGDRIPAYARRVVKNPHTKSFNAQVWTPQLNYTWQHQKHISLQEAPLVYEAHIGMAQEEGKIGTYIEFKDHILPRIIDMGYNTLQLMAIKEHPYYASFGYHVSNFFAPSSRFGTPEELKSLIDEAHKNKITVMIDFIHSHAVRNEVEGISRFDGTSYQYFHHGDRGIHTAWDSRCFDYGKKEVLHFLLSNCRYWVDEFHIDGFRFDGVTSMLYTHHGLEMAFTSYDLYYNDDVDEEAITYLSLANTLIHRLFPGALTVAEDVSGMPGMTLSPEEGGIGFDYRLAMGIPDYWIKLAKEVKDEHWQMGKLWHEITNRRKEEKTISYVESHDQALVGDQTYLFRLVGKDMFDNMSVDSNNVIVERGIALHKIVRLLTLAAGGDGYLNFMGNEFGHPEWIDFPREGNEWSYHYARRQWSLVKQRNLYYARLAEFDRMMLRLSHSYGFLETEKPELVYLHEEDQILAFKRSDLVFIFNFNVSQSFVDYSLPVASGRYKLVLNTDHKIFGGQGHIQAGGLYISPPETETGPFLQVYLPPRTGIVLVNCTLK